VLMWTGDGEEGGDDEFPSTPLNRETEERQGRIKSELSSRNQRVAEYLLAERHQEVQQCELYAISALLARRRSAGMLEGRLAF
jgi:hypothetical protein